MRTSIPRIRHSLKTWIYIEQTFQNKAAPLKRSLICERLSQISRSDNNKIMRFIKSQYLADLCIKILHIISIPLLSESAEIV